MSEKNKKTKNKVYKTENGIRIVKNPENVEEEVLNAIFLSDAKKPEEIEEKEWNKLAEELNKEIKQKEKEK
ncbi:MAG: hypothetical protein BTN85_0026 [Candidatus Methanohalarchaeum thermophilum]|uniref:Uncharacterized protein n=1 Tax=Methanohalarchaeum thermophilum TaxID=1903181 RepID=A0A1Q6DT85_METT1|nr:MAG: hypothetical protein BTN85_0026 [Candidatus Methanohalarchaeum thermophilum]